LIALLLVGCAPGDQASGASEPIYVREGTFHPGELPVDPAAVTPAVVYAAGVNYVAGQGQGNVEYTGLATADAYSVAVALVGEGTGYWVVPVDGPDVTQNGNLLFDLTVDVGREVPYGLRELTFVAIGGDGEPGPALASTLCVLPDFADRNFAACDAETAPQHTVLSLRWDTNVDLDLVVVTPDGTVVDPKSPSTQSADEAEEEGETSVGVLSRDSNADCAIDGVRLESLVFADAPPAGDYTVYANLHQACGQPSVNFALELHRAVADAEGAWSIDSSVRATGALLGAQTGGGLGTYLTTLALPEAP
jgi:hypothetical protein